MNVSFLQDNPINSVIVNSSNGQPLYDVQTPRQVSSRTTTIRRLKPGVAPGAGEIIAEVHWRTLGSSTITMSGATVHIKDWLKKDRMLSSSRILTASDGNSYKWSQASVKKLFLRNTDTNAEAAQSHRCKRGWFGGASRMMNIDISPQGMQFLDTIVVSFIIMEEKVRETPNT